MRLPRRPLELPVKLKVHDSVFVPLAKWAMLLAGNYRCLLDHRVRSIKDAVHSDLEAARALSAGVPNIERVDRLVQALGARRGLRNACLDETVARVDDWLVRNRLKG